MEGIETSTFKLVLRHSIYWVTVAHEDVLHTFHILSLFIQANWRLKTKYVSLILYRFTSYLQCRVGIFQSLFKICHLHSSIWVTLWGKILCTLEGNVVPWCSDTFYQLNYSSTWDDPLLLIIGENVKYEITGIIYSDMTWWKQIIDSFKNFH